MTSASATSATDQVAVTQPAAGHGDAEAGPQLAQQLHDLLVDSPDEASGNGPFPADGLPSDACGRGTLLRRRRGRSAGSGSPVPVARRASARVPCRSSRHWHGWLRPRELRSWFERTPRARASCWPCPYCVRVGRPNVCWWWCLSLPGRLGSWRCSVRSCSVWRRLPASGGVVFPSCRRSATRRPGGIFSQAVQAAAATESLTAAAERLADGLAKMLPARLVALGLRRAGGLCRVLAVAPFHRFDPASESGRYLEAVLAEAMLESPRPAMEAAAPSAGATDSVQQLLKCTKSAHLQGVPLSDAQGEITGACVLLLDSPLTVSERETCTLALSLVGLQLDLVRRARSTPWARLMRLRQHVRQLTPRGRRWLITAALALVLVLCGLPLPYRLTCPCEVQPVTRRYVVAPYDGRLETACVEPGDWVTAGQILARMDGADIRLEMAGLKADLQRATKQRDSALAAHATAADQIARLEMERLQLRIELLQERMDNLEIRSPTDGVIISGDPKKLQGARLTMGQTLVEVGPLGQTVLEVAIRDEDISHAREGSPVRFRLEALPSVQFQGELRRIHPRSEQRDGRNVFMGQVTMSPGKDLLRPGMRGRAKILAARRPLFWILFHRAWEHVLLRFAW